MSNEDNPVVRYYDAKDNPEGRSFPFVPLADIRKQDWDGLEDWQRESVEASKFWQLSKPRPPKAAEKPTPAPTKRRRAAAQKAAEPAPIVVASADDQPVKESDDA